MESEHKEMTPAEGAAGVDLGWTHGRWGDGGVQLQKFS